jgi:hypothetical protein
MWKIQLMRKGRTRGVPMIKTDEGIKKYLGFLRHPSHVHLNFDFGTGQVLELANGDDLVITKLNA